jgi:hypothetical protein
MWRSTKIGFYFTSGPFNVYDFWHYVSVIIGSLYLYRAHSLQCSSCFYVNNNNNNNNNNNLFLYYWHIYKFHSPSLFYLLTVGVEVVYFHLITLRHTPHLVGLLWTRDRPVAENSTWQHKHSQETNIHTSGGIGTHHTSKPSAADLSLWMRGRWDRRHIDKRTKRQITGAAQQHKGKCTK